MSIVFLSPSEFFGSDWLMAIFLYSSTNLTHSDASSCVWSVIRTCVYESVRCPISSQSKLLTDNPLYKNLPPEGTIYELLFIVIAASKFTNVEKKYVWKWIFFTFYIFLKTNIKKMKTWVNSILLGSFNDCWLILVMLL